MSQRITWCLAVLAAITVGRSAPAQAPVTTVVRPNDPAITWSEYFHADIDSSRADFTRPNVGLPNSLVWDQLRRVTPGVRATFRTDATDVRVAVDYIEVHAIGFEFSIEVDGLPRPAFGVSALGKTKILAFQQPTQLPRVVSITWPIGADVDLIAIELTGGTSGLLTPAPTRPGQLVVCYGDSITHGLFFASEPRLSLPGLLATRQQWRVINAGFSGHRVFSPDSAAIAALAPGMLVLAIGTNDYTVQMPLVSFAGEYTKWITGFRDNGGRGVPILRVTPISRDPESHLVYNSLLEGYRQEIRSVVAALGSHDPDLYLLEGRDMVPDRTNLPDDVHPNDAGYLEYADVLEDLNLVRNARFLLGDYQWQLSDTSVAVVNGALVVPADKYAHQEVYGLSGGQYYEFSACAAIAGPGSNEIALQFFDTNGQVGTPHATTVMSTTLQLHSLTGIAPPGTVRASIVLGKAGSTAPLRVDDMKLPLFPPATVFEFAGCNGLNPADSLVVLSGRPGLGATFRVGMNNSLGSQASVLSPVLGEWSAAATPFPCGMTLPGLGLAGPGTSGEVLVDGQLLGSWIGSPWTYGSISHVDILIPASGGLAGVRIYLQGLMCDASFCGLTNAIEIEIGS